MLGKNFFSIVRYRLHRLHRIAWVLISRRPEMVLGFIAIINRLASLADEAKNILKYFILYKLSILF